MNGGGGEILPTCVLVYIKCCFLGKPVIPSRDFTFDKTNTQKHVREWFKEFYFLEEKFLECVFSFQQNPTRTTSILCPCNNVNVE